MFQEMELSDSKTKKLLIIFQKKTSLKFRIWKPALFSPSSKNIKTSHIFSKQSFLYISGKGNPGKKFIIPQETDFSFISGNGNSRKSLLLQKTTFRALKMFLIS